MGGRGPKGGAKRIAAGGARCREAAGRSDAASGGWWRRVRRTAGAAALAAAAACSGDGSGPDGGPTYHRDVAPILAQRCAGCHVEGGVAPFALTSFAEAAPRAGAIAAATGERKMPPWGVDGSGACGSFVDSRWLSDGELETLARWAETGAPEGERAPPPERPAPATLRSVGATLDPGVTYTPDATRTDDYRCFLVDAGLSADRYLVAYEVKPGEPRTVHHVILYSLEDDAAEAEAVALDDAEPGPGYTCFGGSRVSNSRFLAGWAPGTPATRYPEGTGIRLRAGRQLVMQVHYNLHQGPLPDRSTIDLELAEAAEPALVIPVADFDLAVPPGEERAPTSYTTPPGMVFAPVLVHGVFPHMHTLGRTLRLDRLPADAETMCLADVFRWDFNWQQFYFYETPTRLEPGDRIRLECVYDTRGRTETVRWGEGTQDEMCLAFLYVTVGT